MGPSITISSLNQEVIEEVTHQLKQYFADAGLDEVVIEQQRAYSSLVKSLTFHNPNSEVITADILLYFSPNHPIPELAHIDTLERWFPDSQIQVPIAAIDVKSHQTVYGVQQDYINSFTKIGQKIRTTDSDRDLPFKSGYVLLLSNEDSATPPSSDDDIAVITDIEDIGASPLVASLIELAEDYAEKSRAGEISYQEIVDSFDPEVFHFNEVLSAYRDDRVQNLVILLSVFFEGYVKDLRTTTMRELQVNEAAGKFYSEWEFKDSLDACRFFGSLEDSDYDVINKIRNERNSYAHNIQAYHGGNQSATITDGTLEKAIRLYEELIGVKKSMLDEA